MIRFVSSSKSLLILFADSNSVRKVFFLYFRGTLEVHNVGILFGFVYTDVVRLPSWCRCIAVSRKAKGFSSLVKFVLRWYEFSP